MAAVLAHGQDQQVVYTGGVPRVITLLPGTTITNGSGPPSGSCVSGSTYTDSTNTGIYNCLASAWVPVIAPGSVAFQITGTCVAGWTELSQLGSYVLLTTAAGGGVGTTGGSNSYTPAGTVAAPTFTGSSATTSATSGGTPAGTNGTAAFTPAGTNGTATTGATSGGTPAGTVSALTTGADSSTTGGVAKAIAQTPTFTGSALATHTHTVPAETFTGTAGTVPAEVFTGSALATHTHTLTATGSNSAPAFTGTGATIQPTYLKLIGCSKN